METIDELLDLDFIPKKAKLNEENAEPKPQEEPIHLQKTAYTETTKHAFTLMFNSSSDTREQAILKGVLEAPLKVEEPLKPVRYTLLDKQKEAKKKEEKYRRFCKETEKLEKARLDLLVKESEVFHTKDDEGDLGDAQTLSNNKPLSTLKVENAQNKIEEPQPKVARMTLTDIVNQSTPATSTATRNRKTKSEELLLEQIKNLYITYRCKYVTQYKKKDGTVKYGEAKVGKTKKARKLHDSELLKHIRQKSTVAVLAGEIFTSFICFDVDSPDLAYSKEVAIQTKNILINKFLIEDEFINISFSGGKGYHIELFFEEPIKNEDSKLLYLAVKQLLGPLKEGSDVEYRPTNTQAVKLPLSINRKTDAVCYFVDNETFKPILAANHILSIKQIPVLKISEILEIKELFTFKSEKVEIIEEVFTNVKSAEFTEEDDENQVVSVLNAGHLLRNSTRNDMTFKSARFLNSQGNLKKDTLAILNEIMKNTWVNHRLMFSVDDTLNEINEETKRIVEYVYINNSTFQKFDKEIEIYKSEMEAVISIKQGHLRNLLYSFILHSKKYAKKDGSFFFAYSTMSKMGNAKNRGSLLAYVTLLEEAGYVEIINRGTLNKALTREYGRVIFDTNTYRLTLDKPEGFDPSIIINPTKKSANMYKNAKKLVDEKTIKENTSRDDWDNHFRKLYKK